MAASPFLRDQFGRVVGRQFVGEEEVGGTVGTSRKQLDALADERRDLRASCRAIRVEAGCSHEGQKQSGCSSSTGSARMCSAFSHTALGSNGSSSVKLTTALAAIDAFEREQRR